MSLGVGFVLINTHTNACVYYKNKVDTESIGFLVESESTCTKEAMENVVKEISRVEREELHAEEEEQRPTAWPRQKFHFTLIRCAFVSGRPARKYIALAYERSTCIHVLYW